MSGPRKTPPVRPEGRTTGRSRRTVPHASTRTRAPRFPAGRRAAVLSGLFAPAVDQLRLPLRPPFAEHGPRRLEQLRRIRVRLRGRPADETALHLVREDLLEVRAHVLGSDEHDACAADLPHARVERVRDTTPVALHDLVDVALVPRLRPAALIVPAGDVLRVVRDLHE